MRKMGDKMNSIVKNARVNAGWVITLLSLVFFSGFAQAQTVPQKTQPAPKQTQVAPKPVQASPIIPSFDHAKTGFLLRDIHTTLRCEQCHVDGIFKNTPKECAGCHSIGSRIAATPKPINHVQTTAACDTCHSSPTTFMVASFKHLGISSGCRSCHNGQSQGVVSKPANHFPTLMPCENCHNTTTFAAARMDHTGITTGCASCHLGQFVGVVSKPASHIATPAGAGCEACHNTVTFLGATYGHDLATVTNNCYSCHGGPMPGVVGKPPTHLPTTPATQQCDACHTQTNTGNFTTFLGATYNHTGLTGGCYACHNGSVAGATAKPAGHVTSGTDCFTCHKSFTTFLGAIWTHPAGTTNCFSCHNGVTAKGKPTYHVPASNTCDQAGCHASTSSFAGVIFDHSTVSGGAAGKCSTCHGGAYPGIKSKPPTHMATSLQCDVCHSGYATFLGAGYNHVGVTPGTCASSLCHAAGGAGMPKSGGHIPTSNSCDDCHVVGATFYPGRMDHTKTVASRCDSCHNGSYTSQGIAGGALPKVSNHIPTTITGGLDCNTCHKTTLSTSSLSMLWTIETMNHNGATGGGTPIYCVTCHLSGNSYLGSMQKFSHNAASMSKDCSKSGCHRPLGSVGSTYIKWN